MRVIVTGAAGFIGYHLAHRLMDVGGCEVLGIDSLNHYYDPRLKTDRLQQLEGKPGFRFLKLDLADAAGTRTAWQEFRPDYVLHMGAQAGVRYSVEHPEAYLHSNLAGFLSVLEACRHTPPRHLVFASSSSVYGANRKIPFSEADRTDHPVSLYAATKKANEGMAHAYAHLYGLACTGLRFFTVYGPWGRPDMTPILFAHAISRGEPISLFNHGNLRRDFTYIDDIATGVLKTMECVPGPQSVTAECPSPAPFRIFNIGNHEPVEMRHFIGFLEKHLGKRATVRLEPASPGDVEVTYADTDALRAAVGFAPSTPLDSGLARFCEWYRSYYG